MEEITELTSENVEEIVLNYKTKHLAGFTRVELLALLEKYSIDVDHFYDKLGVNTVMVIETEVVTYHCDILKGLRCVIENREQTYEEWD